MVQPTYPPPIDPKKESQHIIGFMKNTFEKTGKEKALLALSGGVDSSAVFLLTVQALGAQNVFALHLPAKASDPQHLRLVRKLIKQAKLPDQNFTVIPIGGIVQKTGKAIKRESIFHKQQVSQSSAKGSRRQLAQLNRLRLANLAARTRMMILYDQAKLLDTLVVGTENHSEHLLGYYTRFGDEASDVEPIKHLYKTHVYQLAQHLKVLKEIIDQEPTAGLWLGQTDREELGFSYEQADPILYLASQGKTITQIVKLGFGKVLVNKVLKQVATAGFKHHVPYQP